MRYSPALARLRRHRGVASLVALGLLCRALIPAGFMPAPIGAGGPVAVCHGGLAGEFFRQLEASRVAAAEVSATAAGHDAHAAHGGHADHAEPGAPAAQTPAADHEGWEHCPFGAAFGAALLASDVAVELPELVHSLQFVEPSDPVPYRPVSSYSARGPPSAAIHS